MKKNLTARTVIIVVTILICVFGIIGIPKSGADIAKNFSDNIRLGLDLKGGTHLVLEIQVQDAVKADADQTAERLKEDLKKQNIAWNSMDTPDRARRWKTPTTSRSPSRAFRPRNPARFATWWRERYPNYILTAVNSTDYTMKLKPTDLQDLKVDTVKRAVDTIGNRIDQLGLAEKSVQQYGEAGKKYEVLVQLPGVDDPARAKELIGTAAVLEIVDVKEGPFPSQEAALSQKGGILPLGTKLARSKPRGTQRWRTVVPGGKNAVISGREMRNARPGQDEFRKWETNFSLSQDGGRRFGRYTEANIGNKLGVLLDNQLVQRGDDSVEDRRFRPHHRPGQRRRSRRSFALSCAAVRCRRACMYLQERSIGPSLGADSIHQGLVAGIAGLLAVMAVMLIYYKRSGLNAVLALVLNTVLLLAAISYFHAVLTLPGIAGIILTIGMAVDSNVLIFERIREELRSGKSVIAAVDTGFGKAWWTIVDTHVTTVVSCAFLFLFGEGPVRGFAVTLTIGLIANIFTAVFVSKTIFDYELSGRRQLTELSI